MASEEFRIYSKEYQKYSFYYHRFSFTKKCRVKNDAAVRTVKKIPNSTVFGHQNDYEKRSQGYPESIEVKICTCACNPNVDRITAAGTSNSTPYFRNRACQECGVGQEGRMGDILWFPSDADTEAHSPPGPRTQRGRTISCVATGRRREHSPD